MPARSNRLVFHRQQRRAEFYGIAYPVNAQSAAVDGKRQPALPALPADEASAFIDNSVLGAA